MRLWTAIMVCTFCIVIPVSAGGRVLQQADTCPLVFKSGDLKDTVTACARGNDPSSLVFNVDCCTRIAGLVYQSRVRYANVTDQLLMSPSAADACIQDLQAALIRGSISRAELQSCNISSTSLWQPACGNDLTTVSAFKKLANYSYPGPATAACWNQPDCTGCKSAMNTKIASLQNGPNVNASLLASPQCKDLSVLALVSASYPLVLTNSIADCFWKTPIDYLPQSPTCTTLDYFALDYTAAYQSCGPPRVHNDCCCDILLSMAGLAVYNWANKTGLIEFQTEVEACSSAYRSALVAHGLPGSLLDQCRISSFFSLVHLQCSNYTSATEVPTQLVERVEGACGSGQCNKAGNCKDTLIQTSTELAGPSNDQALNSLYCIFFYSVVEWPKYGPQGGVDRLNCYYDFPPELQLSAKLTSSGTPTTTLNEHGLKKGVLVAIIVGGVAGILALGLVTMVLLRRHKSRHRESEGKLLLGAQLASFDGIEPMQWFTLSEIRAATQNFSERQLLGEGGSGKVYLGRLPDGASVAVKNITNVSTSKAVEEFVTEAASMASCRHRHIVAPKGIHASERHCVLVYEYAPNGSLEDHLFALKAGPVRQVVERVPLSWPQRFQIAIGTAKGLAYLHEVNELSVKKA